MLIKEHIDDDQLLERHGGSSQYLVSVPFFVYILLASRSLCLLFLYECVCCGFAGTKWAGIWSTGSCVVATLRLA